MRTGVEKFVHTSTSEVYGTAQYVPIDEKHPLSPQSPYSATKIGADAIALSFFHAFELPVVVARPFNTYGPRQSARAVIPTIITQLAAGRREVRLGELTTTRDFTFVEDTCRGLLAIADARRRSGRGVQHRIERTRSRSAICSTLIADVMGVARRRRSRRRERVAAGRERSDAARCDGTKLAQRHRFHARRCRSQRALREPSRWFRDPATSAATKPISTMSKRAVILAGGRARGCGPTPSCFRSR